MSTDAIKCPKCGGPMLSGQMACTSCWAKWREDCLAYREQRQAQEAKRDEAKEQGKMGEVK